MIPFLRKFILLFSLSFLFVTPAIAQATEAESDEAEKQSRVSKQADEFFVAKEYSEAIRRYKKAYGKSKVRTEKAEIALKLADCYRYTYDYRNAASQYKRAVKLKINREEAYLGHADMLKAQGEYADAIEAYEEFAKAFPKDARAAIGIASSKDAIEWTMAMTLYQVGNVTSLNSEANDFSLTFAGRIGSFDELFFSSMRSGGMTKREDGWTGEKFSDIYSAERLGDDGQPKSTKKSRKSRKTPKANTARLQDFSDPVMLTEIINTEDHEGSGVFDARRRTFYFTRCMDVKQAQLGCGIYQTRKAGINWQDPSPVVLTTDSSESVGHPHLIDDKVMVFAGDMTDGRGGKDLWITTFDKKKRGWGMPVNMGPLVNTTGDELFPYVHDGYLYFASTGHPGMGGYDLFRIALGKDNLPKGSVMNLQAPINSPADDFNLILRPGDIMDGYFVSNRSDGKGSNDIWSLYQVPKKHQISGNVLSSKDQSPIAGVTVKVRGKNGFSQIVQTDGYGNFTVDSDDLQADETYSFAFERKKFLRNGTAGNTMGLTLENYSFQEASNVYMHTMSVTGSMDPIEIPIVLPEVNFDLAKWDLRPTAQVALDTVARTMVRNPNIVIQLRSHTDYRDADDKNVILSQKRADTCVKYLISKGVRADRLEAVGMGEGTPFVITGNYEGFGKGAFKEGTELTEALIRKMNKVNQEIAHQINRRTDFRVLRDDYVPPVDEAAIANADEAGQSKGDEVAVRGVIYVVGDRESYSVICKSNSITLAALKKLNGGLRGVRPFPGMQMKVTDGGDYAWFDKDHRQIQRNETWKTIAKELGMKLKALKALNPEYGKELSAGGYLLVQ